MKVLFIAGTLGHGGAENQLYLLTQSLVHSNNEVIVISLTQGEYWENILDNNNVKVICIKPKISRLNKLIQIIKITKYECPDLVYSFHFYTSIYAGIVGRITGIFCIGSIRGNGWLENEHNGFWKYLHFNLPNAIIGNSFHGLKTAIKLFRIGHQYTGVLLNVIDTEKFRFRGKYKNVDCFKVVFIGRLIESKRPYDFIKVVQLLNNESIPVKATIIGDGPLRDELENLVIEMSLEEKVVFTGNIANIYPYLEKSDAIIQCSNSEGTPNVILEAMSTGVAVYSANLDGIKFLLGENNERGIVFNSIDELVLKLKDHYLNNMNYKTVLAARHYIEKNHAMDNLPNNFFNLLNKFKVKNFD